MTINYFAHVENFGKKHRHFILINEIQNLKQKGRCREKSHEVPFSVQYSMVHQRFFSTGYNFFAIYFHPKHLANKELFSQKSLLLSLIQCLWSVYFLKFADLLSYRRQFLFCLRNLGPIIHQNSGCYFSA